MPHTSISVVIPAYNSQAYIGAALESVLAQTHPVNEILVVDDESTDSTETIVASYPQVKWIRQHHQGPSAARNYGIRQAQSEWVAFLDSDDLWQPQKTEKQLAALASFPSAGFSFSTLVGFSLRDNAVIAEDPYMPRALCAWLADRSHNQGVVFGNVYRLLLESNCVHTSSVVARRDALIEIGLFDESMRHGEDHDLWLRLSRCWPAAFIAQPTSQYRIHSTSISGDRSSRQDLFYRSSIKVLSKHRCEFPSFAVAKALTSVYNDYATFFLMEQHWGEAARLAVKGLSTMPTAAGIRLWLEATLPSAYYRAVECFRSRRSL